MAVTFTQKAADRISRAVKWVEQQIRTQGPSEGTVTPRSVEPTYVLTTSGTATSGFYPGKVVLYSAADAAWQEYTTCKILPANGETLTNNTRYAARYTGRNAGGDGVFAVLQGTAGSLTVEEQDGSPSYTDVTKIRFDQADGFSLSNPSTGTARVDILDATASQAGIVSTTTQTVGGLKAFNNAMVVHSVSSSSSLSYTYPQIVFSNSSGPSPTNQIYFTALVLSDSGSFRFSHSAFNYDLYPMLEITQVNGSVSCKMNTPNSNRMIYLRSESNQSQMWIGDNIGGSYSFAARTGSDPNPNEFRLTKSSSYWLGGEIVGTDARFVVRQNSLDATGVTGNLGSGAKVAGGIVYSLGTVAVQSSSWMGF